MTHYPVQPLSPLVPRQLWAGVLSVARAAGCGWLCWGLTGAVVLGALEASWCLLHILESRGLRPGSLREPCQHPMAWGTLRVSRHALSTFCVPSAVQESRMGGNENTAPTSGLTARRGTVGNTEDREGGPVEDSTELHINEWTCAQAWPFTLKSVLPRSREFL